MDTCTKVEDTSVNVGTATKKGIGTYTSVNTAPNCNWSRVEYLGNLPEMLEEELYKELSAEFAQIKGRDKRK